MVLRLLCPRFASVLPVNLDGFGGFLAVRKVRSARQMAGQVRQINPAAGCGSELFEPIDRLMRDSAPIQEVITRAKPARVRFDPAPHHFCHKTDGIRHRRHSRADAKQLILHKI